MWDRHCPQTSVRNYHPILHNIPEQVKPHVPTFKIILLPPSSSLIKFQHTSNRLPGFTSQKTANIKIQFISSDRKMGKFMAGLEILRHSDETKPLWRPGIPHFHKLWLCGRNEVWARHEKIRIGFTVLNTGSSACTQCHFLDISL